jgi:hypothetical protein
VLYTSILLPLRRYNIGTINKIYPQLKGDTQTTPLYFTLPITNMADLCQGIETPVCFDGYVDMGMGIESARQDIKVDTWA